MNIWIMGVAVVFIILGIIRLRHDLRDFFGAIVISFGGLMLFGIALVELIMATGKYSVVWPIIISYLLGSLLIVGTIWFLIKNTRDMEIREGVSVAGKLSLAMGVNVLFIVLASLFLYQFHSVKELSQFNVILGTLLMLDLTFVVLFICYVIYSFFYQMVPIKEHMNYIIVLGSGIRTEEVPPLLQSRLNKAMEYYLKNNGVRIIVSGGQGPDEPISEAAAMKKYLIKQGIPEYDIIEEGRSTTTLENMIFSKRIMDAREAGKEYSVMFTTNNYHVFRAAMYAKKADLRADGVGAPTAFYFLPTAMMREFIGILSRMKLLVGTIILFWLAVGLYFI